MVKLRQEHGQGSSIEGEDAWLLILEDHSSFRSSVQNCTVFKCQSRHWDI